jgi:hypothetical protein
MTIPNFTVLAFKHIALSRLAAQHDEIDRLRAAHPATVAPDNVRQLTAARGQGRLAQRTHRPAQPADTEGTPR